MNKFILIINSGSATLKFRLYDYNLNVLADGLVERIGLSDSFIDFRIKRYAGRLDFPSGIKSHEQALRVVFEQLKALKFDLRVVRLIGHRVVFGGEKYRQPVLVNKSVVRQLETYYPFFPLHLPPNLGCIKACMKLVPRAKNITCFDTGFFKNLPEYVYLYGLPYSFYQKYKIRVYGFHGLNHQWMAEEAARRLKKPFNKLKIITCHLGSGSSMAAVKNGKAIDTSLGFGALNGLIMGTRTGDLDPLVPLYLTDELKLKPRKVREIFHKKSGLLGLSGVSSDMREIMIACGYKIPGFQFKKKLSKEQKRRCHIALNKFIYQIQKYIGSFAAIMGGLDVVVFSGGIGERNADIRNLVIKDIKNIGRFKILVIPADEELIIARGTKKFK